MKQNLKSLALLLSVLIVVTMVGCSGTTTGTTTTTAAAAATSAASAATSAAGAATAAPVATQKPAPSELTYWRALDTSKETAVYSNWTESQIYGWISEATNCNVTFIHPPAGQEAEKFNLMIASGDYTDIIERDFSNTSNYPGGVDKAVTDGVIISLNEPMENGLCPNLVAYFDEHPEWISDWVTDAGNYTCFPFIREDDILLSSWGPQVRIDWLEKLDMGYNEDNLPTTIAEWDTILRAFKSEGYCENPLLIVNLGSWGDNGSLPGAWDVGWTFYADKNGELQYGPCQDAFREYLTQMRTWVADGLVDPDWTAGTNTDQLRTKIMGNSVGIYFSNLGGGMGYWYDTINSAAGTNSKPDNPEGFRSYALPQPVLEAGTKSRFGGSALHVAGFNSFISTSCKDVEGACRFLDYGYGEEGALLYNHGKEGVSFEYVNYADMNCPVDLSAYGNSFPKWTEEVTNSPKGFTLAQSLSQFVRSHSSGPFPQDESYLVQFMAYSDQLKTIETWNGSTDYSGQLLPRMFFTTEESESLASMETDLTTYKDETITKFLTGGMEINDANWQAFQDGLKQMGVEDVLSVRRAAYQRALDRGNK